MADKKMIAIGISFENCDFLTIPWEYVGIFQLNKVTYHNVWWGASGPVSGLSVRQFIISFDRGLKDYSNDKDSYHHNYLERIEQPRHIASIKLIYNDGSESESFYPTWHDTDEDWQCENPWQRSKRNTHGDLFLEIGENTELDSMFPDETINADDYSVLSEKEDLTNEAP